MTQPKMKLVGGKFVVEGEPKKEVKPIEAKVELRQYSEEVLALKDRVINGNQKLFDAWLKIKELAGDEMEWVKQMSRWHDAGLKLQVLCTELKARGYTDCLYIINDKRTKTCLQNPDGFWCQACPSSIPYWDKELMGLPKEAK